MMISSSFSEERFSLQSPYDCAERAYIEEVNEGWEMTIVDENKDLILHYFGREEVSFMLDKGNEYIILSIAGERCQRVIINRHFCKPLCYQRNGMDSNFFNSEASLCSQDDWD